MPLLRSTNKKKSKNKKKIVINAFDCYRCKKPVRLTREENQPGKLYHIMWINYKEYWANLCPNCSLNLEEWLGVKPYQTKDLTAY
jgi:hypothetical protein